MARKNEYTERVDKIIGERVHELRLARGLSRQQLSDKIDVSHQQLQKYEVGTNRISAGRLAAIALALGKPVSFFFDDIHEEQEALPTEHQRMCLEVSRNFLRIKNTKQQAVVNLLIKELAVL